MYFLRAEHKQWYTYWHQSFFNRFTGASLPLQHHLVFTKTDRLCKWLFSFFEKCFKFIWFQGKFQWFTQFISITLLLLNFQKTEHLSLHGQYEFLKWMLFGMDHFQDEFVYLCSMLIVMNIHNISCYYFFLFIAFVMGCIFRTADHKITSVSPC